MKENKMTKSQCSIYQAYEVLHEYIDIFVTFLEKLFNVTLLLKIPTDSVKYLVNYFIFLLAQPRKGDFESALKVKNTNTVHSMQLHSRLHDN